MTYQEAKTRIETLSPFAYIRPDGITRRGDSLIARRSFPAWKHKGEIGILWAASIRELFPEARITKTAVDRKNHARCWLKFE